MQLNKGRVEFTCNDLLLERGFYWAKARALSYAHEGDPVGAWYEAALPGRDAFCMRDTAHYALGAQVLGLLPHNKNMLCRFAENISETRDYCSYWEITKQNEPLRNDYTNDEDYWYNLPANFDILQACWSMFQWTDDHDYLHLPELNRFYNATVSDYIRVWDTNGDGIPERKFPGSRRGIPSYDERDEYAGAVVMGDLIAAQAQAFDAYARIHRMKGNDYLYEDYTQKASSLRQYYDKTWWNAERERFYSAMFADGSFHTPSDSALDVAVLPLYYGLLTDAKKRSMLLDRMKDCDSAFVEYLTYLPEVFYQYGRIEDAYQCLLMLTDPKLKRREYPEIAFSVVGAIAVGIMGIEPHADRNRIRTVANLPAHLPTARMENIPVFGGEISVEHAGNTSIELINKTGNTVWWQPVFPYATAEMTIDGETVDCEPCVMKNGDVFCYANVKVENGYKAIAKAIPAKEE